MCGRLIAGPHKWAELYALLQGFLDGLVVDPDAIPPVGGYNVKPTQQIAMVKMNRAGLLLTTARWWFVPHWHKGDVKSWKATTFNAKIETAAEKPTFRSAWTSGRCLIPAQGYYEWTGQKGQKQPWYIAPQSNLPLFFFAGLQSRTSDGTETCTILTRSALGQTQHLHPRSPVMLATEDIQPWLAGEDIPQLGGTWDGRLQHHTVRRFGQHDDGPDLIEPDGLPL